MLFSVAIYGITCGVKGALKAVAALKLTIKEHRANQRVLPFNSADVSTPIFLKATSKRRVKVRGIHKDTVVSGLNRRQGNILFSRFCVYSMTTAIDNSWDRVGAFLPRLIARNLETGELVASLVTLDTMSQEALTEDINLLLKKVQNLPGTIEFGFFDNGWCMWPHNAPREENNELFAGFIKEVQVFHAHVHQQIPRRG